MILLTSFIRLVLICKTFLFRCHSCHKLRNLLVNIVKEHHPFSRMPYFVVEHSMYSMYVLLTSS